MPYNTKDPKSDHDFDNNPYTCGSGIELNWLAVKELKLSYHNSKTILFPVSSSYMVTEVKFLNSNPVKAIWKPCD